MAMLVDEMTGESMVPAFKYGGILLGLAIISLVLGVISARNAATAGAGFAKNLRKDMYYRIQDFSFTDIDSFSTSSLITRMTTDVTNVQNAYQMIVRIAVRVPLEIIFSVIMCLTINTKMALIFIAMIPVTGGLLAVVVAITTPIFKRIFKKYDALNNSVQENVAGIRVVKSFVREDYERKKFKYAAEDVRNEFTRAEKFLAFNTPIMNFCIYIAMTLLFFLGGRLIVNSGATELTTGELSSLITYGAQILSAMMMLSMVFVMVTMAGESAQRITEVITHDPSIVSPEDGLKEVKDGSIKFENVSFKYSEKSRKSALSDINLEIGSGQTVGIIGGTGSSKTTLIQLISRLYDVTEGSVTVGGEDVRHYDLEVLRNSVAVVLQKNVLFSGSIKDNLRWGNKEASDGEMIRACQISRADEFIDQFPEGYDYHIEQGGTNLSGGQKQRLCIARALLKNPKVIIFDDSTSAVDTKTDAYIRSRLAEELPDTTKIIIAQRISSVQDADFIIVMDGGKIVEKGTHEELMALGGIYREVADSQVKGEEEE